MHNREGLESAKTVWSSTKMLLWGSLKNDWRWSVWNLPKTSFTGMTKKPYLSCLCRQFSLFFALTVPWCGFSSQSWGWGCPTHFTSWTWAWQEARHPKVIRVNEAVTLEGMLLYCRRVAFISQWERPVSLWKTAHLKAANAETFCWDL